MLDWLLIGLPCLAAVAMATATGTKADGSKAAAEEAAKAAADTPDPNKPDPSATATDDAAKAAKEKADSDAAKTRTTTLPEEQLLAMQTDIDKLTASRDRSDAEAKRERGRTRKAREDLSEVRKTASPELQQTLTAETIAEAMVSALKQTASVGTQPVIPGLKYEADGEVTFNGRPIDPDVAEILVKARQDGDSMAETVKQLQEGQARIEARYETEDSEREAANLREVETRHITRMEEYGVSICDQSFSEHDENIQEVARENYYANLGRVLHGLDERGVNPEQITPELISRISTPIIERLEQRFEGITPKGQKTKADEAKKDEPLKRGGSAAEPGRSDFEKMTPEQQDASLDKLATELAGKHEVGSHKPKTAVSTGRAAY